MSGMSRTSWLLFLGLVVAFIVGASFFWARPALAQVPPNLPPNLSCRGCHGDNQRSVTLPSGELLPLLVDLAQLDNSAHSYRGATAVICTDCHTGDRRYRYPHAEQTAQTQHEYTVAAAQSCESCHYPHNPFHEAPPSDPAVTLPTCVECHGSHTVAPLTTIAQQMPANCIACHTDQAEPWAADLLKSRPGHGEGATGYAGSDRCLGCHADLYLAWRETLHANIIQEATADPAVIVGDFGHADPDRAFAVDQVAYVIGSRWRQQYITRTVEGNFELLPAQWNVATEEWVANNHPDLQAGTEWRQACSGCHVTGLETTRWEFTEFGVGCENCHGPSEAHIADPENVKPFTGEDDQVCGACHSRGASPDGLPFPATYRPGDKLSDHFTLTSDSAALWPDGSAKYNHQQYMDWQLGSKMMQSDKVRCTTCHAVHDNGAYSTDADSGGTDHSSASFKSASPESASVPTTFAAQLRQPLNDLCLQCHNEREQQRIVHHMPYHEQVISKRDFLCTDCHMPKLATSAEGFDLHNHSFLQPNPQGSLDHGGMELMPNACNQCHNGFSEDPAWALQTIAYADKFFTPNSAAFFGAGPTPTSPPPPTPLPSVGQAVERMQVETGRWLRNTIVALFGLAVVGVAGYFIYQRRARSARND